MENLRGICTRCGQTNTDPNAHALVCSANDDLVFLQTTDWQIRRYKDQIELGIPTSLTEAEYTQMQLDRQAARDRISANEL